MKFIRSQKAQSVPSSTSSSKPPPGQKQPGKQSLENVSKQSDSSSTAQTQNPREVTMEKEGEEEGLPPPPAVMGMTDSE